MCLGLPGLPGWVVQLHPPCDDQQDVGSLRALRSAPTASAAPYILLSLWRSGKRILGPEGQQPHVGSAYKFDWSFHSQSGHVGPTQRKATWTAKLSVHFLSEWTPSTQLARQNFKPFINASVSLSPARMPRCTRSLTGLVALIERPLSIVPYFPRESSRHATRLRCDGSVIKWQSFLKRDAV